MNGEREMTTGVSAPMDFRYFRLVIPIFRTKKIKTAVRSSLFQAVGTTPFLGGEWGIRTPGTVIPYVSLANQCTEKISAKIFLHYTASSKSL